MASARHKTTLAVVAGLCLPLLASLFLHATVFFSAPLLYQKDSIDYLAGADSLVQQGNFAGVLPKRGPGMAVFLGAVKAVAGENHEIAIKASLHVMGLLCVALAYAIAMTLVPKPLLASLCAMEGALCLDFVYRSNQVAVEVPGALLCMLFLLALLRYLKSGGPAWLYTSIAAFCACVLLRPENTLLALPLFVAFEYRAGFLARDAHGMGLVKSALKHLAILFCLALGLLAALAALRKIFVSLEPDYVKFLVISSACAALIVFTGFFPRMVKAVLKREFRSAAGAPLGAVVLACLLPAMLWCFHNKDEHGFFGLTDYTGITLFDATVVCGQRFGISMADASSKSIRQIQDAVARHREMVLKQGGTWEEQSNFGGDSWRHYDSMIITGQTPQQAQRLFYDAGMDSIRAHPLAFAAVLAKKLENGMKLAGFTFWTYPLPGEPKTVWVPIVSESYKIVSAEKYFPAQAIGLQRKINRIYAKATGSLAFRLLYPAALGGFLCCLLLKPRLLFAAFIYTAFFKTVFPMLLGGELQRFFAQGLLLYFILGTMFYHQILVFLYKDWLRYAQPFWRNSARSATISSKALRE